MIEMDQGLRERKKLQTRDRLRTVARELFVERGFEHVTVAEVARAADVSEATVFNYFPTKEDQFVGGARNPKLSRDVRAEARAALAALERGLGADPPLR